MTSLIFRRALSELTLITFLATTLIPLWGFADEMPVSEPSSWSSLVIEVSSEWSGEIISSDISSGETLTGEVIVTDLSSTGSFIVEETPLSSSTWEVLLTESSTGEVLSWVTLETEIPPLEETISEHSGSIDTVTMNEVPFLSEISHSEAKRKAQIFASGETFVVWEVLVEFKEENIDIETSMGQYQIDTIELANDITLTSTLPEENIAIMEVKEDTRDIITSTDISRVLWENEEEEKLDILISTLKKDPRVKSAQKNFIYRVQAINNDPDYSKTVGTS